MTKPRGITAPGVTITAAEMFDRLQHCRAMLSIHRCLPESENEKVKQRIYRRCQELKREEDKIIAQQEKRLKRNNRKTG